MKVTVTIIHVDGKTPVKATGLLLTNSDVVNLEYRYRGMTYGHEMMKEDVLKLIKK